MKWFRLSNEEGDVLKLHFEQTIFHKGPSTKLARGLKVRRPL